MRFLWTGFYLPRKNQKAKRPASSFSSRDFTWVMLDGMCGTLFDLIYTLTPVRLQAVAGMQPIPLSISELKAELPC
jgi:hypothetical protein